MKDPFGIVMFDMCLTKKADCVVHHMKSGGFHAEREGDLRMLSGLWERL